MSASYSAPFAPAGPQPVTPALAQRLLAEALSRGGDFADLYFEFSASGSFAFEDGLLRQAGRSVSLGMGVRVLKGEATGLAYVESLDEQELLEACRTAAQIASAGKTAAVPLKALSALPTRYSTANLSLEAGLDTKRALLARADARARAADPRIARVDASLSEEVREFVVATSDGIFAADRQPLMRFGVRVIAEDGTQRQSGSSGGGGRLGLAYFDQVSPEQHADEAVRQALVMLDAREAPAGDLPVVLGPGDSGILLHEAVGHGLEADFNRKKTSNYSGRVGDKVASELCTVVDDARFVDGRGSINVDDEGHVPEAVTLIEQGTLRGYMHDRTSSEVMGAARTGNGRRESFQAQPLPRMTNTLLLAGQDDPQDIIRSVSRGIYAAHFGGGQVDISNGDFVFSLTEGYLIEDGKLTAPLKGVNLIGNGPDAMCRVSMLGSDFKLSDGIWTCGKDGQSVPVGVGCPTIKISAMTVGGTQV